ncbi:MAG: hypothetical protein HXS47_02695 [Theionarchaea archaeon]|nr:hypothetical protein [Theionarchaea archaeon]
MEKENDIDYKKKAEAVLDTLNELVRSVNYFSRNYFNNDIIAQRIYMEAIRFGVKQAKIEIPKAETPMDACQIYIDILEAVGLMASKQFELKETDETILCKVFPPCMYAEACKNTEKEGITPTCLRGLVFHVFIKDSTGENFRIKVVEFNPDEGCLIEIHPLIST